MIILLVLCLLSSSSQVTGQGTSCQSPLGLSSGGIKDNQLSSSSSFSSSSVGAENGRLGTERGGGAWCPAQLVSEHSEEWIQVDLGREMMVSGVITQGRYAGGQGEEFAELVTVQVRDEEEEGGWRTVAEEAPANTDTYSKVEVLVERVRTTAVRVMPVSKHPRMVCLRVELLGCDIDDADLGGSEVEQEVVSETDSEEQEVMIETDSEEQEVVSETEIPVTDISPPGSVDRVQNSRPELENESDNDRVRQRSDKNSENHSDHHHHHHNSTTSDSVESDDRIILSSTESQYMLVSVVVLVTIIVILIITIIFILYKNHQYSRAKAESSDTMESARLPLYCGSEQASYPPSLQTTPYKYYSSPRRVTACPPQSHYYATTDLIHWHNTNLLSRPNNQAEQFL